MPNLSVNNLTTRGEYKAESKYYTNPWTTTIQTTDREILYVNRSTSNTPGFNSPTRIGPLPMRQFLYEKKRHVLGDGAFSKRDIVNYTYNGDPIYQWTRNTGTNQGYKPTLYEYYVTPVSPLTSSQISVLDSKARNKILLSIKDMKVNLAQAIAEREQCISMFVKNATDIANAMREVRRGDFVNAAEHLGIPLSKRKAKKLNRRMKSRLRRGTDSIANRWLELQYGWLPLMSDVKGAAESLARTFDESRNGPMRVKSRYSQSLSQIVSSSTSPLTGGSVSSEISVQGKHEVSYVVYYTVDSAPSFVLASLGLTNPAELAWEVIPYSFVADWFINIGEFLSTFDATIGCRFLSGAKTEFVKWTWLSKGSRVGSSGNTTWEYDRGISTMSWVKCTRTVLNDFPYAPPPYIKDNPFSLTHLANATALLSQFFK